MSDKDNFWLTQSRENFIKALGDLKNVHTNEELQEVTERLNKAREELLEHDEDFKKFIEARTAQARLDAAKARAEANRRVKEALMISKKPRKWSMPPTLPPHMTVRKR